jgi:hypothetical protein
MLQNVTDCLIAGINDVGFATRAASFYVRKHASRSQNSYALQVANTGFLQATNLGQFVQ